jgi:hypothetical protein
VQLGATPDGLLEIGAFAGGGVVDQRHPILLLDQRVDQVRCDEPGAVGD